MKGNGSVAFPVKSIKMSTFVHSYENTDEGHDDIKIYEQ